MLRVVEYFVHRPGLDGAATLHHRDAMAHMLDDAEIMGNEQHPYTQPSLQHDQQIQYMSL